MTGSMDRYTTMRRALPTLIAAVASGLLLLAAPARALDLRTAAQEGAYPKFVALGPDAKSQIGGLCVDIMRAIERVEPDIKFVGDQMWQPLARVEAGVAHGQLDVACGLIKTKEREAKNSYVDAALFPVNYYLAVRVDDDVQVKDWDDIRKLGDQGVILSIQGFVGVLSHMNALGGLRIDVGGRNARVNLEKLIAGRGRFFIHRSPGIEAEILSAGVQSKVKLLPTVIYTERFYMMVARAMPAETKEKMRKAIVALSASGDMAKIVKKWEEPRRQQ